jgi:HTH-type transcriptional regulator / antitoxin HipB
MSVYDDIMKPYEFSDPRRLGAVVRELRHAHDWTQSDLATRAGVSRGYLVRLEQGHPTAELATVLRVLAALNARLGVTEIVESEEHRALSEAFDRIIDG